MGIFSVPGTDTEIRGGSFLQWMWSLPNTGGLNHLTCGIVFDTAAISRLAI